MNTTLTDPRKGLPSSSGIQRIIECAGCLSLVNRLRERGQLTPDHGSEDADRGTHIHAMLADLANGNPINGATDETQEALDLWDLAKQTVVRIHGCDLSALETHVEKRLWQRDEDGVEISSGQFDLVVIDRANSHALVIDYKTGHNDVPHPAANWQLRHAAVLTHQNHGVETVTGCIIQTGHAPLIERWSILDIEEFIEVTEYTLTRNGNPLDFGFGASEENCRYCPARLHCPRLLDDLASIESEPVADPYMMIAKASTPRLSEFLLRCENVEIIAKAARDEMEARLRGGDTDDNWKLEASSPKRVVKDAYRLARAIIEVGADVNKVLGAMSMNVGAAEAVLRDATGAKGKDLKKLLADIGGEYIGMSEPQPTLKRK